MTIPECSYTTSGTPGIIGVTSFTYGNGRRDVLSKITLPDGQTFTPTHDIVGNPSHVMTGNGNRYAATWSYGRRLTGLSSGSEAFSYSYNADGIRTTKTVNGVKHTYALSGTTILNEEWTENGVQHLLMYVYDANGSPVGMVYRNSTMAADATEEYLFVKNIQGDILYVYSSAGKKLVSYVYDAWGNIISTTYSNGGGTSAARFNPFTYRGYYRDSETGMYYLKSRYYNPKMGRFINADGVINGNGDLLGYNLYAYCSNNPVMYVDTDGLSFKSFLTSAVRVLDRGLDIARQVGEALRDGPSLIVTTVNRTIHSGVRTYLNSDLPETVDMAEKMQYIEMDEGESKYHQNNTVDGKKNRKFVSPDGKKEVVYYSTGEINMTPEDEGTYNYVSLYRNGKKKEGFDLYLAYAGHFTFDVMPYFQYGNNIKDKTTMLGRLIQTFS